MSEITSSSANPLGGKIRSKKLSTRIDFTPMVDLGFLLITFFMLTTTLSKPQVMPIRMPDKEIDPENKVNPDMVLTLLLGDKDKVYYYEGLKHNQLDSTDISASGLRRALLHKRSRVNAAYGLRNPTAADGANSMPETKMIVLVKPMNVSRYKNLVDVFDELEICGISNRMMLDVSEKEVEALEESGN